MDGYVYPFDEEADYWKRRLDVREKQCEVEKNEFIVKLVGAINENVRETERSKEEVEKKKT